MNVTLPCSIENGSSSILSEIINHVITSTTQHSMRATDHEPKTQKLKQKLEAEVLYGLSRPALSTFINALIDLLYRGRLKCNDQEQSRFKVEVVVSHHDSTLL